MNTASAHLPHAWAGEVAAIATKHEKQRQFGPPLAEMVGIDLIVAGVDTDLLGTFTGEVLRPSSPIETARRKARWAIDHVGTRFGLASEGSFGAHPNVPFAAVGVELALWLDAHEGLEVVERVIGAETNFQHINVDRLPLAPAFLESAGFPAHALVVSPSSGMRPIFKGLVDLEGLERAVGTCIGIAGRALVQTDMRAHLNPTRQRALSELAHRLGRRLNTPCPRCGAPGWGIVSTETGLPCECCARPTPLAVGDLFRCARAGCREHTLEPRHGFAPAEYCPACNP